MSVKRKLKDVIRPAYKQAKDFWWSTKQLKKTKKSFKGKIWLVIGDSITEHNFRAQKNYDQYISEFLGVKVVNVGASGTGYMNDFQGVESWIKRLDSFPNDVDFITVMGALNDRTHPVGDFYDTDVSTLYGCLHSFYNKLICKYPNTPIGVITSTPREYCWGENGEFVEYVNAVIRVAQHYSLPILDLYRCSGLHPWNETNCKEYFSCKQAPNGDGIHPNVKGQKIIAYKVCEFITQHLQA